MIKIITFSDTHKHFTDAIKEYEKRMWRSIDIINLKPSKKKVFWDIIKEETIQLNEKLKKEKWYKILLNIDWKILSTQELLDLIETKKQTFSDIIFIIWWAYWFLVDSLENIDFHLSFSPMTYPHSMAYLILLEQIYRISMIQKWTWYHH